MVCSIHGNDADDAAKRSPSPDDADNRVRLGWSVPVPEFADEFEQRNFPTCN
ncbi:MAG: hypothetical protein R2694_19110 [Ilumatobacteraceae bacterium]